MGERMMPSTLSQVKRPSTPNDLEMTVDPMQASPRQPLPTSLASFALSHSSSNSAPSSPSTSSMVIDDFCYPTNPSTNAAISSYPLYRKLRRSSLLSFHRDRLSEPAVSRSYSRGTRNSSSGSSSPNPINTGILSPWKDRASSPLTMERNDTETENKDEGEALPSIERSRPGSRTMTLDESEGGESEIQANEPTRPTTPPPRLDSPFNPSISSDLPRRFPLKPPRLLTLLSESKPVEEELRSEASFQRLLASHADLPIPFYPRTPRSARGRFPESASFEDDDEEHTPSEDDESDYVLGYPQSVPGEGSIGHSTFEDQQWLNQSPYAGPGSGMDVDMVNSMCIHLSKRQAYAMPLEANLSTSPSIAASPAVTVAMSGTSTPMAGASGSAYSNGGHNSTNGNGNGWRDTPTASGRVHKRKHTGDERYEPYSYSSSKRRAVSPSVSFAHAVSSSATSSPISISIPGHFGPPGVPRSPVSISRSMSVHSSPILRPVHRLPNRASDKEERERSRKIQGAGDGVRSMNLGS
ncbi:uncharacterized protein EI90DRAFT_794953 [Cantharellus anzutake]|uniref:uncharacterized protein n=1 Tax=Cantharellus anzutake TaxID=1750568 RepID=UPI0019086034|nr:uncharacterized protein EI90DRAFT_794953 [Cantharellus anzutake]KAF8342842.1 hypothetical protein EI90DRAFT_794953 [Cantharellus anzutake]